MLVPPVESTQVQVRSFLHDVKDAAAITATIKIAFFIVVSFCLLKFWQM
jgi:hypothetical protein